jgi:hypothetical protein
MHLSVPSSIIPGSAPMAGLSGLGTRSSLPDTGARPAGWATDLHARRVVAGAARADVPRQSGGEHRFEQPAATRAPAIPELLPMPRRPIMVGDLIVHAVNSDTERAFAAQGDGDNLKTLTLSCSGPQATTLAHDYMEARGLRGQYDLLTLVGGTWGLDKPSWSTTFMQQLGEAVRLHGIEQVVLAGHVDCGPFKRFTQDGVPLADPLGLQLDKLAALEAKIKAQFDDIKVVSVVLDRRVLATPGISREPPHVLLVSCMDSRLIESLRAHMSEDVGEGNYSHFALIGGSLGILGTPEFTEWGGAFMDQLHDEIKTNRTSRLILLDHRGCGLYERMLGADKVATPDIEERTHAEQLRNLADFVQALTPGLDIELRLMAQDGSVITIPMSGTH